MSSREPTVGDVLGGRYRLVAVLGRGGMGTVFEGVQEDLGRKVAVKVLHGDLANDEAWTARFRREARVAAALDHPGIVQVTDFQVTPEGVPFLVMERLVGSSLRDVLDRERRLPPERVVAIAVQMLAALGAAHRAGLVHRDVKPDNVFLVSSPAARDVVKLLDFGIAKADAGTATVESRRGVVLGTDGYMAPEQARGELLDARADLYAVGACAYEALVGRYAADDARTAGATGDAASAEARVPLLERRPELDPRLALAIERALEPDPSRRFPSAEEMIAALRDAGAARASVAAPARTSPPTAPHHVSAPPVHGPRTQPLLRPLAASPAPSPAPSPLLASRGPGASLPVSTWVVLGLAAVSAVVVLVAPRLQPVRPPELALAAPSARAAPRPEAPYGSGPVDAPAAPSSGPPPAASAAPPSRPVVSRARDAGSPRPAPAPPSPSPSPSRSDLPPGYKPACGGVAGDAKLRGAVALVSVAYSDTSAKRHEPPPEMRRWLESEVATTLTDCYRRCPPLTVGTGPQSYQLMVFDDGTVTSVMEHPPSGNARFDCLEKALVAHGAKTAPCPAHACTLNFDVRASYDE